MKTIAYSTTLTPTSCGECGIPFALPSNMYSDRVVDGKEFWCPNGHKIGWKTRNEQKRLEADLKWYKDKAAANRAEADQLAASLRTAKGHVARLRNRALAGECPICGKHLFHLDRHVQRMHKDEQPEPEEG